MFVVSYPEQTILGRTGQESDMAACILFLAGPGGVFLNSQVLYPDGGEKLEFMVITSAADEFQGTFWCSQQPLRDCWTEAQQTSC